MSKKTVVVFTLILACFVNSYSIHIDNEFTFITSFGGFIHDYNQPPVNPFDCQLGCGYSAFFTKYYMKVDGEILYSLSEMKSRKTTTIVDRIWDEDNNRYQYIYGETDYKSLLISVNVVPCLTLNNFYAGLGLSAQIRQVKFHKLDYKSDDSKSDNIFNGNPYITLGYSWKYFQSGVYINGFVQRAGVFFKVNLLTIKKGLH